MRYALKTVLASLPLFTSPELYAQRPILSAAVHSYVAVDSA